MTIWSRLAVCLSLGLWGLTAQGAAGDAEARLAQVMNDAKARAAAAQAGKRAAFFCENCHGATGNSPLEHVPNLAGQNPVYLLNQIDKFGDGRRKDEFMSGLVKVLKPEDRFNIAVFYATQAVQATPSRDARLAQAGLAQYQRACQGCHGAAALGTREVARLAGQRRGYLETALRDYRAAKGTRRDPRMTSVARQLGDEQIRALAAYLSGMK
ncbi:MAG: c-type cytochrome [Pseudomonadota bacterium]